MTFVGSTSHTNNICELIHYDLWTSPVVSVSGHKYYLLILDDRSHFVWTFPLRVKSDTFFTLSIFFAFASTQFGRIIKHVQCNNDHEFDNASSRAFFTTHGAVLRMSCPYTSPQNGKAECTTMTSIMLPLEHSSPLMGRFCGCPAPTLLHRTVKPSVLFTP
jgi:hypothetical protein